MAEISELELDFKHPSGDLARDIGPWHARARAPARAGSPKGVLGIFRLVCRPCSVGLSAYASPDLFGANDAPGCACMRPPFARGWCVYSGCIQDVFRLLGVFPLPRLRVR
jgi:hypothetical protein